MLYDEITSDNDRVIVKSYAKINLTLDVLERLENSYHNIKSIMQTVSLFDEVTMDKASEIEVLTNVNTLPSGNGNIAYKAAKLFFERCGIPGGVKISLQKNIPIAAGLAGGSGNAAAVLCGLNYLYDAGLSGNELLKLGLELGADVPFCMCGGTYLAEGVGEKLTPVSSSPRMNILLVKPDISISTAEIYKMIDSEKNLTHPDTDLMINALKSESVDKIASLLGNIMETVTIGKCREISDIKSKMLELGAIGALMSGSGPTVFAIFRDDDTAKKAFEYFSKKYKETFLTHTVSY